MKAVTTFSPKGYEQYGKRFLETFVKHWPIDIDVYYEEKPTFEHKRVTYKSLLDIVDRKVFIELANRVPAARGVTGDEYCWAYDSVKFCNKVFAQLDCKEDQFFWLDADIVTYKDVPEELLKSLIEEVPFCYFGREGGHTETGFIGFNRNHQRFNLFSHQYRQCYLKGIIFHLPQWHDCYAFDFARLGIEGRNLSPDGKFIEHVIAHSFLSEYFDHLKGNRKVRGYSPESKVKWW